MKFHLSIRSKTLLYMSVPIVLTIVIWGLFAQKIMDKSFQTEISSLFSEIIDSASDRVKLYLNKEMDKFEILARNQVLIRVLEKANSSYDGSTEEEIQVDMLAKDKGWILLSDKDLAVYLQGEVAQILRDFQMYEKGRYREIFITDAKGGLVAATNKTTDFYQADESWWQETIASQRAFIGDVEFDESSRAHSIALSVVIHNPLSGNILGVLKVILDVNEIFLLGSSFQVGKTGAIHVFNSEGKRVYEDREYLSKGGGRLEFEKILNQIRQSAQGSFLEKRKGHDLFVVYKDVDFSEAFVGRAATHNRWHFFLAQDADEAFLPLRDTRHLRFFRNVLISFLLLVGAFVLASSITRPLLKLVRYTREITAGHLDKRIDLRSQDEFGELAGAFNQMLEKLNRQFSLTEASERRYKALFESAKEGILVMDKKTFVIVNINESLASVFSKTREFFLGMPLDAFLLEFVLDSHIELGRQTLQGTKSSAEFELLKGEKERMFFAVSSNVFEIDQNQFVQSLWRDITEKRQIDSLKSNLIRDVAHELRTPVAKISMSLELLLDNIRKETFEPKKMQLMANISKKSIERLSRTIENILDFSRLQEGKTLIQKEIIPLNDLLSGIWAEHEDFAKDKGLTFDFLPSNEKMMINGDERLLKMAIGNLLSNAIKFTSKGYVRMRVAEVLGKAQISVEDTGIGIPSENLSRVFEKFYQLSSSIPGCGIGLAISEEIVRFHGGKVWAESSGEGKGAIFKIELDLEMV